MQIVRIGSMDACRGFPVATDHAVMIVRTMTTWSAKH